MKPSRSRVPFLCVFLSTAFLLCQVAYAQGAPGLESASNEGSAAGPQAAHVTVSPTALNFGQVLVGETSSQRRVSLKNTGQSEVVVTSITISGNFAMPVNHCAAGVKPGTHCDVFLTFTPKSVETESGALTFVDNASGGHQKVSLTGTGSTTVSTLTTVTASPRSFLAGQPVTLTATITSSGGVIPNGDQVAFSWPGGETTLGSGTLQDGVARITTSSVYWRGQDTQKLVAQFTGDQNFLTSEGAVDVLVTRYSPAVTATSTPNPSMYLQPVTMTGNVNSGSSVAATGHMFLAGLCGSYDVLVVNGIGTHICKEAKNAGSYQVQANYLGDGYNTPGDAVSTQVVNPSNTTTTVKSSTNPSVGGHAITLTAIVTAPWAHVVEGSITFSSGTTMLGTVDLQDSRGSITISSLPAGQNTITATYSPGNGNFVGSSASLVQTVN